MSKLYIMVGLQGSGKSYTIKNKLNKDNSMSVFSSDMYRKNMFGDENDQTHNNEIWNQLYKDLREALFKEKDCILDATNITRKDRSRVFHQIQGIEGVEVIAYVMRTPIEICLERDRNRTRKVGFEVIDRYVRRYEFPQKFEGFSQIIIDDDPIEDASIVEKRFYELLEDMKDWDQCNPHHIHCLYDHAYLLADHFQKNSCEFYAGILHDVGKMIVGFFDDQGIAHYYNHDSVGTYYILSRLYPFLTTILDQTNIEYLLFLINYHMKGHRDIRDKAENKYRKLFGDKWYNQLISFANADIEASGTESIHDKLMYWMKIEKLTLKDIRNNIEFAALIKEAKEKKKCKINKK